MNVSSRKDTKDVSSRKDTNDVPSRKNYVGNTIQDMKRLNVDAKGVSEALHD